MSTLQEQLDRARQDGNNVRQQLLEAKQSDGRRLKEVEKYVSQDVMNGLAVVITCAIAGHSSWLLYCN